MRSIFFGSKRFILKAACIISFTAVSGAGDTLPRIEARDLFRAQALGTYSVTNDLARERLGRDFAFAEGDPCNFIYFSPEAGEVAVDSAGIRFTTTGARTVLGWGNFEGRQRRDERLIMFSGWNEIELQVSQSAEESEWTAELWADGSSRVGTYDHSSIHWWMTPRQTRKVTGTESQTVRFRVFKAGADGFGLVINGPEDNNITIESIRITQTLGQGYYRKAFDLPRGEIWRAVAELPPGRELFVNGRKVAVESVYERTAPVDLAPYLVPGRRNVIALAAEQSFTARGAPLVYLQGRVIMADGQVIDLDAGLSWRAAAVAEEGWETVNFDDRGWEDARTETPGYEHFLRRWPVYDGRLLIENPGNDPLLYFDAADALQVRVRVPRGLAGQSPSVAWVLRRVERENRRPEIARGVAEQGALDRRSGSLVFSVDAGPWEAGVYTLETALLADGDVIERRFEEPLILVERLPMREVPGDDYEQGIVMELEQVIDFTDPDGPHRWIESAPRGSDPALNIADPRIVEKNGLRYREVTDPAQAAMFSYRFEFARPHGWYLMVLEYPNDAERWTGISVTSTGRAEGHREMAPWQLLQGSWNSEAGPSLVTGGKYPLDDCMHEMRWLHWADPEVHTLDVVSIKRDLPAAAARLRIYRVDELPAMKIDTSGERFFGIHTERARSLGRTFSDSDGMDPYQRRYGQLGYDMLAAFTQRLRWHYDATRNYTEYLRFTGQNLHVMGAFQYAENNTPYTPPERVPGDGRLLQDIRETALRFFERNGITMYSMVEYIGHNSLRERYAAGDSQVAAGADVATFVNKDGQQGGWHMNPLHPSVEQGYLRVADNLAEKFSFSPAWKGIYYCVFIDGGGLGPAPNALHHAPFDFCYADTTIAAFERDTGLSVPGDAKDPARFRQRYLFLTSEPMLETWVTWRTQLPRRVMQRTQETLHAHRSDLNVLYGFHTGGGAIRYWLNEAGLDYATYFRQMGMDPSVVKDEPHLWFGRYIYPTGAASGGNPYHWEQMSGDEPIATFDVGPNRLVALNTMWHELPTVAPGYRRVGSSTSPGEGSIDDIPEDWPMPSNVSRFITQAHGANSLEAYTAAMIGADPDYLVFGFTDVNIINSREQEVREVARLVTALPKDRFEQVLGTADFRHNLALRALRRGRELWFYAANPCPWPLSGTITMTGAGRVAHPHDGSPVHTESVEGGLALPIELGPFGLLAFRVEAAGRRETPEIVAWEAAPSNDEAEAHLRGIVEAMRALLAEDAAALAVTADDRVFIRELLAAAEGLIARGEMAAAWRDLTHWRLWTLRGIMERARHFSARLPGLPAVETVDPRTPPRLEVAALAPGETVTADGRLEDPVWNRAPENARFLSIGTGQAPFLGLPLVDTALRAAYDDKTLYLALRLADPEPGDLRTTASPENPIQVLRQYDDTVVLFLNPDGERVVQFAFNAAGVRYAARDAAWGVGADDLRPLSWDVAVQVEDGLWQAEVAIPFDAIEAKPPASGTVWRANVIRRFREFNIPESYWAHTRGWGDLARYGYFTFQ